MCPGLSKPAGSAIAILHRLARIFSAAGQPLAIPGGPALAASNGVEAGQAILTLNALVNNLGQAGGVFLTPGLPVHDANPNIPDTLADLQDLVQRMNAGKVKVLFIHGVNPVFELPAALGFVQALSKVPLVISFASFPDETAMQADYVFPDHTGLEAWGYQKILTGADRPVISGLQPVVEPVYDTRATADVFLAAVQAIGGDLATAVPYKDEVEYMQQSLLGLVTETGFFNAQDINSFWELWQQNGGWWNQAAGLGSPAAQNALENDLGHSAPEFDGQGEFYLMPFFSTLLSDGSGANKPWLQEIPDPTTTVVWNTWVEIIPGYRRQAWVSRTMMLSGSPALMGKLEASVYRYPAIRPDTLAIPFGQGHTVFGRYAQNRGANLAKLLGTRVNAAGDLALNSVKVKIEKTGRKNDSGTL